MEPPEQGNTSILSIFQAYTGKPWGEILVGKYDYRQMCMPTLIGRESKNKSPFFAKDEPIPLLLGILMGFQHAVAVVGGLVLLVSIGTYGAPPATQQYLISCSFIVSGIVSVLQICAIPIPFTGGRLQIGTGMLSLVGTSSTFVSLFMSQVYTQIAMDPSMTWEQAYGGVVGALTASSLVGLVMAMLPHKALRTLLPPLVSGITVMLIGTSLADAALQYWGGGIFCARYVQIPAGGCQVFNPAAGEFVPSSNCYIAPGTYPCQGNGDVTLPFGAPQYIGLGFFSIVLVLIVEAVGSPFARSASAVIAILGAFAFAACFNHDGDRYVATAGLQDAPWFTFLWVKSIPLSFYFPAFLPGLILNMVDMLDTVGDVTATSVASHVVPEGKQHMKRIKGAMLADVLATVLSGVAGGMPLTTYSQNNGIISMSNCASRIAGLFCCVWLVIFGVVAKIGAFFSIVPNCVLGGIVAYIIGNIIVSGINIICMEHATRRNRVILSSALVLGIGIEMVPQLFDILWVPPPGSSQVVMGLKSGIISIMQNGVSLGAMTGLILNLVLPMDSPEDLEASQTFGEYLKSLSMGLPTHAAPRSKDEGVSETPLVSAVNSSGSAAAGADAAGGHKDDQQPDATRA